MERLFGTLGLHMQDQAQKSINQKRQKKYKVLTTKEENTHSKDTGDI